MVLFHTVFDSKALEKLLIQLEQTHNIRNGIKSQNKLQFFTRQLP